MLSNEDFKHISIISTFWGAVLASALAGLIVIVIEKNFYDLIVFRPTLAGQSRGVPVPVVSRRPGTGEKIKGLWLLRRNGETRSAPIARMTIEANDSNILVDGHAWSGRGRFDGARGYYEWIFPNGSRGRTALWIDSNQVLHGEVRGAGIDWDYIATRN